MFDDALTTASILFCANDNLTGKVQFSNIHSLHDLSKLETLIANYPFAINAKQSYSFSELNPEIKWKAYYQTQNGINSENLVPFSTYAKVVRGIATGSNEYFTFNLSKAKAFGISEKFLLPCICSARKIPKTSFFTSKDFELLSQNDKTVFLFNAQNASNEKVQDYIVKGELEKVNLKYLTAFAGKTLVFVQNRPP